MGPIVFQKLHIGLGGGLMGASYIEQIIQPQVLHFFAHHKSVLFQQDNPLYLIALLSVDFSDKNNTNEIQWLSVNANFNSIVHI